MNIAVEKPVKQTKSITLDALMREYTRPTRIRSRRYGTLRFRRLVIRHEKYLLELLRQESDAREFVVLALHNQLERPVFSVEEVRGWKDTLLLRAAAAWALDNCSRSTAGKWVYAITLPKN